jgi:1-acyl-sn-glycerol-3-phosphate acyltransferase
MDRRELAEKIPAPVFSAMVWGSAFGWMTAVSGASLVGFQLLPYHKVHNGFMRPLFGSTVKLTMSDIKIERLPGYDPDRRSLYCQNHVNVMDGHLASYYMSHAFCGMMEASHFRIPGYGWIMRLARGIPVYPRASGRTAEITTAAKERVDEGLSILCFPEAHRTMDGLVRPFRRGVFFMARDAGIPIVPVAVRGFYEVNRKGTWLIRPGTIHVQIGAQVETAGLSDEEVTELASRTGRRVAAFVEHGRSMADWDGAEDAEEMENMGGETG